MAVTATESLEVHPGELWWAELSPTQGREQSGRRPVLVVSGDDYNETVTTLALVVPVTSVDRGWPNHVRVAVPGVSGWAMTEQLRAVSRGRLVRRIGQVTPSQMDEVSRWLNDYLT